MASLCWNPQSDCESEVSDLDHVIAPASKCEGRRTDAAVKVEDDPEVLDGDVAEIVDASSKKRGGRFQDSLDAGRTRQCRVRPEWATNGMEAEYMRPSLFVDDYEATRRQAPCESTTMERSPLSYPLLEKLVFPLKKGDREYQDVEHKFLGGLSQFASGTVVTGISRDASARGQARLQAFEKLKEITRKVRGDENERFAWHGTSQAGVSGIFLHGFGQPRTPKNGSAYGVGVYLAPEGHSHVSAIYADNDENGEQHVVLCKVILGASELVAYGSTQFHPSSEEFDTGVDDLVSPRRLIVWSTHMNTHILPLYVVSFRLPPRWHHLMATHHGKSAPSLPPGAYTGRHYTARQTVQKCDEVKNGTGTGSYRKRGPTSPFIYFPHLFLLLSPLLAPETLQYLKNCHRQFQARRLTRLQFIQHLRDQVGDHRLVHAIKLLHGSQVALLIICHCEALVTTSLILGCSSAPGMSNDELKPVSMTQKRGVMCGRFICYCTMVKIFIAMCIDRFFHVTYNLILLLTDSLILARLSPQMSKGREQIKYETSISSTAREEIKCETPLSFTAVEKIECETPLSFSVVEKVECGTPLSFSAGETVKYETPLPFTVV
jgi:hypothetical protein